MSLIHMGKDVVTIGGPKRQNYAKQRFEGDAPYKAELLPLQESLLEAVRAHRAKMQGAKHNSTYDKAVDDSGRWEISEAYFLAQGKAREQIDARLEVHKRKWLDKRDPQTDTLSLLREQQRTAMLTDADLAEEIADYVATPAGRDPIAVECLMSAVTKRPESQAIRPYISTLRQAMKAARYTEPWLAGEEARQLTAVRELYSAPLGKAIVACPEGPDDCSIAELFED
jgi:hypothetical protein